MGWVTVVVVGFAALNALVIALGRDVTARWEQDADPAPAGTPADVLRPRTAER